MFSQLFKRRGTLARYIDSPLAEQRLHYLNHCVQQGVARSTLKQIARSQLITMTRLDLQAESKIGLEQIEAAADWWVSRQPAYHSKKGSSASRVRFISDAVHWLRFLGRLYVPAAPCHPEQHRIGKFADYMKQERGWSPLTIYTRCRRIEEFLHRFCSEGRALCQISILHIDEAIAQKGSLDGCTRASVQTYAYALRAFFRYAETQGWCASGLAAATLSPRVYKEETLPAGPCWEDVQHLCANTEGDQPGNIRAHAIVMLLAVYGLRAGEVRRLRLEDLDWEKELISVTRSKQQRRTQIYPLSHMVGETLLRYLKEVRPRCPHREVFLSLKAPFHPLSNSALWQLISRRLRSMGLSLEHQGPHSLRHACATRLLAQGSSMKEIGDYLGHRSPAATHLYAKVDLSGLRQVGNFSLGGLS